MEKVAEMELVAAEMEALDLATVAEGGWVEDRRYTGRAGSSCPGRGDRWR